MKKKKIFFLLLDLNLGGAQQVIFTVLHHLDREKFQPVLVITRREGAYAKDIPNDLPVYELKKYRYAIPRFLYFAWRDRPKVIFCTLGPFNIALIALRFLLPRCRILVQEVTVISEKLKQSWKRPKLWRFLYQFFYPQADYIFACSNYVQNDLSKNFSIPRNKIVCVYNCIDIEHLKRHVEKSKSPFSGPGPHLLSAGRLVYLKGFDRLLNAFTEVHKKLPTANLTIVGSGNLERELIIQRDALGLSTCVHVVGYQDNLYRYMYHANLYILSSRYEGLSVALLEAMACGCPVVAVDCPGGVREAMEITGNEERLVKPEDLAFAIISSLSESSGRKTYSLSEFDVKRVVKQYSDYF